MLKKQLSSEMVAKKKNALKLQLFTMNQTT